MLHRVLHHLKTESLARSRAQAARIAYAQGRTQLPPPGGGRAYR